MTTNHPIDDARTADEIFVTLVSALFQDWGFVEAAGAEAKARDLLGALRHYPIPIIPMQHGKVQRLLDTGRLLTAAVAALQAEVKSS